MELVWEQLRRLFVAGLRGAAEGKWQEAERVRLLFPRLFLALDAFSRSCYS